MNLSIEIPYLKPPFDPIKIKGVWRNGISMSDLGSCTSSKSLIFFPYGLGSNPFGGDFSIGELDDNCVRIQVLGTDR